MRKLFINLSLVIILASNLVAKDWRGIVPLHSTREEVEKLFGVSEGDFYKFETERVWIFYSLGNSKGKDCVSKTPKDTITRISVLPEIQLPLESLNLNLTKFKKIKNPHNSQLITYYGEEEGVTYEVNEKENNDVTHITYYPNKKDCENVSKNF